jgi:hypothetical protein
LHPAAKAEHQALTRFTPKVSTGQQPFPFSNKPGILVTIIRPIRKSAMTVAPQTIDHSTLSTLVEAGAVRAAQVVGQPGGWGVVVQYGMTQRTLAAKRGVVRIFRRFETLAEYLRSLGIVKYQVDASQYDSAALHTGHRADASARLKHAHESAAYDSCLREKVGASLAGMQDGSNPVIPPAEWEQIREQKRRAP